MFQLVREKCWKKGRTLDFPSNMKPVSELFYCLTRLRKLLSHFQERREEGRGESIPKESEVPRTKARRRDKVHPVCDPKTTQTFSGRL